MKPAIRVENLSKQYRIGANRGPYRTLRESINETAARPFRWLRDRLRSKPAVGLNGHAQAPPSTDFWALKDVSFDVKPGQVVGIIGRNGAGKSTLLKILSRITEPTRGRVGVRGRISSLLEVGTGFHPELTGRENVFLNGSVLGMTRRDTQRRFDEIVGFAEIDQFLDTPVKRFSSGMYMRLAFAIAAHLEPDILVVDEVLAVGDASFQKKCLSKLEDVGQDGRTVLFVSHNMPAITRLCSRSILLKEGQIISDGRSHDVVREFLHGNLGTTAAREFPKNSRGPGNDVVQLRAIRVRNENRDIAESVDIRRPVHIEMEYDVLKSGWVLVPNIHVYNEDGICVFVVGDLDPDWQRRKRPPGRYTTTATIPGNFLAEGSLFVGAAVSTMDPVVVHFFERDAVAFQVTDTIEGDSVRGDYAGNMPGVVRPLLKWTNSFSPNAAS